MDQPTRSLAARPLVIVAAFAGSLVVGLVLMLWTFGRTAVARVRLEGAEADVTALRQSRWSI